MKKILFLALVVTAALAPLTASAAPPQRGPYTSAFVGITVPHSQNADSVDYLTSSAYSDRVEFDPGVSVGGTGGYDFGVVRVEGEISYKYSEINSVTERDTGYRFHNVDGNMGVLAVMFNSFVDLHNRSAVTPYLGGGIGFASIHLSDTFGTDTRSTPVSRKILYNDDYDSVFAYQVGGGLEIALNRRLSLDVGYRYFRTDTASIGNNNHNDIVTDIRYESHNANVGVRFKF